MSWGRLFFLVVLMSLFMMMSCSHTGKVSNKEQSRKEKLSDTSGRGNQGNYYKRLVSKIQKNDYKAALDLMQDDTGKEKEFRYGIKYISAINELLVQGEKKMIKLDYENSGKIFNFVMQNYPNDNLTRKKIIYTEEKINEYLYLCSEKIMEMGLSEYRKGNLWNAVSIWEKILIFNPRYVEANNAIETTKKQMNNIRSLEKPNN